MNMAQSAGLRGGKFDTELLRLFSDVSTLSLQFWTPGYFEDGITMHSPEATDPTPPARFHALTSKTSKLPRAPNMLLLVKHGNL